MLLPIFVRKKKNKIKWTCALNVNILNWTMKLKFRIGVKIQHHHQHGTVFNWNFSFLTFFFPLFFFSILSNVSNKLENLVSKFEHMFGNNVKCMSHRIVSYRMCQSFARRSTAQVFQYRCFIPKFHFLEFKRVQNILFIASLSSTWYRWLFFLSEQSLKRFLMTFFLKKVYIIQTTFAFFSFHFGT